MPEAKKKAQHDRNAERPGRRWFAIALYSLGISLFVIFYGFSIVQKEWQIANSVTIVLELRPRDPRSLVQGDYMNLRLPLERQIAAREDCDRHANREESSVAIMKTGFVRLKQREPEGGESEDVFVLDELVDRLPPRQTARAPVLPYRSKNCRIRIGSGNFFFQEGSGGLFQAARFVRMRVADDGSTYTEDLLDEKMRRIKARKI